MRVIHLHYSRPERKHDWLEQIVVLPPGRHPDEVIKHGALSLINMDGEVHRYSWHEGFDLFMTEPAGANISSVHLKSKHRPFLILPPGPAERAYRLKTKRPAGGRSLSATLAASDESSLENPAFIIENWGRDHPVLFIDGKEVVPGDRFRFGVNRTEDGEDLVIWLGLRATDPVTLSLQGRVF